MSYQISYGGMKEKRPRQWKPRRLPILTVAFFMLFLLTVERVWPAGRERLRELLWPGNGEVTAAAFATMTERLDAGEPIADAVEAFCKEILQDAREN